TLLLYAKLGQAEAEYKAGHYGKARELLDPVVAQFKDSAQASQLAAVKEKDPGILRVLLGYALRANVQDNKVVQGKEILDLLEKTFPDNSQEILVSLVGQLREQIKELREKGDSAKEQLEKTKGNFSTFLGEL